MSPSQSDRLTDELSEGLLPLNRRTFLKAGLVVAAGSGLALTGCSRSNEAPPALLSAEHAQLFRRLMQLLLPVGNSGLPDPLGLPVINHIEDTLASLDSGVRKDLTLGMDLFAMGSVVLGWHWRQFVNLGESDAIAYIERWQNGHPIQRGIITTLKKVLYVSYWRIPETWSAVAYDGPVSEKWQLPSLGNSPLPVEATQ